MSVQKKFQPKQSSRLAAIRNIVNLKQWAYSVVKSSLTKIFSQSRRPNQTLSLMDSLQYKQFSRAVTQLQKLKKE